MNLRTSIRVFAGLLFSLTAQAQHQHPASYAGQQARPVKALSATDVDGYLNGRGMGLAKAAELNGYPGPMHALELAEKLNLSAAQKAAIQREFDLMHDSAVRLGQQVVEKETSLDRQFAGREITQASLETTLQELASLQARLRQTHLQAHLATRRVLSDEQVSIYNQLRGYTK
jgi:Spy/CpxP family protein refolding chaperone